MDLSRETQEYLFESAFKSAPDAVLIINADGKIKLVNTQCIKMFGYDESEIIDNTVELLIPKRFHTRHIAHRKSYNKQPYPRAMGQDMELFGLKKGGGGICC